MGIDMLGGALVSSLFGGGGGGFGGGFNSGFGDGFNDPLGIAQGMNARSMANTYADLGIPQNATFAQQDQQRLAGMGNAARETSFLQSILPLIQQAASQGGGGGFNGQPGDFFGRGVQSAFNQGGDGGGGGGFGGDGSGFGGTGFA